MNRFLTALFLCLALFWAPVQASNYYFDMFKGTLDFQKNKFESALKNYTLALKSRPDSQAALYNLGTTQLRLKQYDKAGENLSKAAQQADKALGAKAEYNLGNLAFAKQQLPEALKHYIKVLELTPQDQDAKYNIQVIRELMKKQQKQQDQKNQQQKNQQQKSNQKENKPQNKKQPDKKPQPKPEPTPSPKNSPSPQQASPQQPKPAKTEMSKDEAERLLRYFNQKEKENRGKQKNRIRMQPRTEEDW